MFYRSTRSNTPNNIAYRIFNPALLEVVMIFGCFGLSTGCLGYELYLKYKEWTQKDATKTEPTEAANLVEPDKELIDRSVQGQSFAWLTGIYIKNDTFQTSSSVI